MILSPELIDNESLSLDDYLGQQLDILGGYMQESLHICGSIQEQYLASVDKPLKVVVRRNQEMEILDRIDGAGYNTCCGNFKSCSNPLPTCPEYANLTSLHQSNLAKVLSTGASMQYYDSVSTENGSRVYHCTLMAEKAASGEVTGIWDISEDVTTYHQLKETINNQKSLSKRLNELLAIISRHFLDVLETRDNFIAIASHELRTPLTTIRSYTDLILESLVLSEDSKNADLTRKLSKQLERMTRLVKNLIVANEISKGKLVIHSENLDINSLIENCINETSTLSRNHNIRFKAGDDSHVYGDRDLIGNIICNLVCNAIKYSPKGGEISIEVSAANGYVSFIVRDAGVGISKEFEEVLRGPYRPMTDALGQPYSGIGVGLFIARHVLRRLGGRLWGANNEGPGAQFGFNLPQVAVF